MVNKNKLSTASNPKNAETRKNLNSTFGAPKKIKK